ncbi:uncharacterized protein SAPINGB_P003715 [Magnusiomyces paraingens]|uniref:Uncharacterized protein n=1 Tax=Magnusiomyces paraingens TaxID=2606893 RepID=A0A5E8BT22_9ASCO|nr:uncharacterized protein SAPINGB_P003715 [Saprochaete ingens]VVT53719.1 unnamed protein product [Saprochaete ingens]
MDEVRDILPSKGQTRLYLFQHRIPHSYQTVLKSYAACLGSNDAPLPKGIKGSDLVKLKNVLETHRKRTGSIVKSALRLEANLIERAAELGDNTAIALLCGRTLLTPLKENISEEERKQEEDDRLHAVKLLDELSQEHDFGLAYKIKGDVAYKHGSVTKAESLYQACIDSLPATGSRDSDSNTATLRVECLRNIGIIRFRDFDIETSRTYFELAVLEAENNEVGNPVQAMDCHYYLGQIMSESDKQRARYHLEQAARQGLKESFAPLGFLLLNYFSRSDLAQEWFDLGADIGEVTSLIGQFDVAMLQENYEQAEKSLEKIKKNVLASDPNSVENQQTPAELLNQILKTRSDAIEKLEKTRPPSVEIAKETVSETTVTAGESENTPDVDSKSIENGKTQKEEVAQSSNYNELKNTSRWDF